MQAAMSRTGVAAAQQELQPNGGDRTVFCL